METLNATLETLTFFSDQSLQVDKEAAIIRGVSILTKGKTRDGRFTLEDKFLEAAVKFGNENQKGIKSRFGHPSFLGGDAIGTVVGRFRDFRIKGEKVLADAHLLESARISPVFPKDPVEFLLKQAKEAPEVFGVSIVFEMQRVLDDHGELIEIKMTDLSAVDMTDEPAANHNGLFSNQKPTQEELKMKDEEKKAQEDALSTATKDGKKEGGEATMNLFSELSKAFPDEHEFVAKQFSAGASVEQATVEFKDVQIERLKKENKEASEKHMAEKAELEKKNKEAAETAAANEGGEGSDALATKEEKEQAHYVTAVTDRKTAIFAYQKEKSCSYRSAVRGLSKERPELFHKVIPKV